MRGWGKGLLWVNGFNLGWYWPLLGPQMRIFVPGPLLRVGSNEILLLEFAQLSDDATGEPPLSAHATPPMDPMIMKRRTQPGVFTSAVKIS